MNIASVIVENNINKPLDYLIPENFQSKIKEGMLVEVPLRGKLTKGIIIAIKDSSHLKEILQINRIVFDEAISKDIFSLAIWMSAYYCSPLSKILKCIIPSSVRNEITSKYQILIYSNKTKNELLDILKELLIKNPKQAIVIEHILKSPKKVLLSNLLSETDLSKAPIESLIKKKILSSKKILADEIDVLNNVEYFQTTKKVLNNDQQNALDKINNSLENNLFSTHLIYGVTGSGKTEVYMQAIEKALSLNKSAIMLVPEISLTTQTIERFRSRFKEKMAIFHHKRSSGEKSLAWENVIQGKAKIIIGARSCIFAPVKDLGLIIVDEEHDPSYKQTSETPTYNAKHLAIMRGKLNNATIVLASATPSIESYYNAMSNKFILSSLFQRTNNSELANVKIVNMKIEKNKTNGYFSEELLSAIKQRYEKGEQTILFINRRGYNTSIRCTNCDYTFRCPHCDITLTYHKKENNLRCHLCGTKVEIIKNCPSCQSNEYIKYQGYGSEHIQNALKAIFPHIRSIRVDRDTTTTKDGLEDMLKQFRSGKADVLIGTQMIVKGLHYPSVTLVGILNTDAALNIPDFRASERVFQLITQACGRAGRAELKGEVLIQTYMHDNDTIKYASKQDYLSFYEKEIETRKLFEYPPFCQMVKIAFLSKDELKAKAAAVEFRKLLIENVNDTYKIHPVLPCGRAKIKDVFKYQFLIRGKNIKNLCLEIKKIKDNFKAHSDVIVFIDVDPIDTYF
ncbi:MAG: primosomal protein N' [Parachlamydiales bacterium]|jgi:primosomal protein N' (replication factor Y)